MALHGNEMVCNIAEFFERKQKKEVAVMAELVDANAIKSSVEY